MAKANREHETMEAVGALVKAAIGESKVWVRSYSQDPSGFISGAGNMEVTVELDGEVSGKLVLHGAVTRRVTALVAAERKTAELERLKVELEREKRRTEKLKDRLSRLHTLSDPSSRDFAEDNARDS